MALVQHMVHFLHPCTTSANQPHTEPTSRQTSAQLYLVRMAFAYCVVDLSHNPSFHIPF
jgi:hypothetical protein